MGFTVAVAGKGGVGKTSVSALIIRDLLLRGKKPVLAVDADANANLNEALGVDVSSTVGSVREQLIEGVKSLPPGMSKEAFVELKIEESLVESEGFDLLVMGRPEGPGCYCYANNILRRYVDALSKSYPYIVIDNEAGMEHLSRRTTQNVDLMLIVSDATPVGLMTAKRIWRLAEELKLNVKEAGLVLNRIDGALRGGVEAAAQDTGIPLAAVLPVDEEIAARSDRGEPLLGVPEDSKAARAVSELVEKFVGFEVQADVS